MYNIIIYNRYLSFFHAIPVEVFNVAEYRLKTCGVVNDAEWFDLSNKDSQVIREKVNEMVIDDVVIFLNKHANGVALIDSTNPTHARRLTFMNRLRAIGSKVIFIEVMNDNEIFLAEQAVSAAHHSPDYAGVENVEAVSSNNRQV